MKPEAHGIDDRFTLRPQVAKQLKHVKHEEGLSEAEESHRLFKQAFRAIGEKSTYKALATYCTSLSAYYGSIKKEFITAYKQEIKKYNTQQKIDRSADLAGSQLIVGGVQRAKRKASILDNERIQTTNKRRSSRSFLRTRSRCQEQIILPKLSSDPKKRTQ